MTYEEIQAFIKKNLKPRTINVRGLFPDIYEGVLEFDKIAEIDEKQLKDVNKLTFKWLLNQYVYAADEQGLSIFEQELKLPVDFSLTIRERRERIINQIQIFNHYTKVWLYRKLQNTFLPGTWSLNFDYNKYYVKIEIKEKVYSFLLFINELARLKPANITLEIKFIPETVKETLYHGSCQILFGNKYIGFYQKENKSFIQEAFNGSVQVLSGNKYININI